MNDNIGLPVIELAPPIAVKQEAETKQLDGTNPLVEVTRWNYSFTYSMQVRDPQDEVHGKVSFNIADHAAPPASGLSFKISEGRTQKEGVEALQITLELNGELPVRFGVPHIDVLDGHTCERQPGSDPLVGVFLYKNGQDEYLTASRGMNMPGRTFVLPGLDIFECQNAQTEVYLARSADLVDDETVSATVSFADPIWPISDREAPINLATIYSTGEHDPAKHTLQDQLSLLYDALFAHATSADVMLQSALVYEYQVIPGSELISMPVDLVPPVEVALTSLGSGEPIADVVSRQAGGYTSWAEDTGLHIDGARLVFHLMVMSDLSDRSIPVLRLRRLYVSVADLG